MASCWRCWAMRPPQRPRWSSSSRARGPPMGWCEYGHDGAWMTPWPLLHSREERGMDQIVDKLAQRLANSTSRRGFLGKLGKAALGAAAVAAGVAAGSGIA